MFQRVRDFWSSRFGNNGLNNYLDLPQCTTILDGFLRFDRILRFVITCTLVIIRKPPELKHFDFDF